MINNKQMTTKTMKMMMVKMIARMTKMIIKNDGEDDNDDDDDDGDDNDGENYPVTTCLTDYAVDGHKRLQTTTSCEKNKTNSNKGWHETYNKQKQMTTHIKTRVSTYTVMATNEYTLYKYSTTTQQQMKHTL